MKNPLESPGKPQDSLYYKTPVTPEEAFQAIGRLRKAARDEIDRLLRFLDETENHMAIDCEPEDEADEADTEPSLGSFDRMTNQEKSWRRTSLWAFPAVDGEQDDADNEANEASGIGDLDGLLEQAGAAGWQGPRGGMG